jgi:DNA-binding XRE family transcriptional regulator
VLRVLRRRFDLSQRQLAAAAGVPKSTVADIESGRSIPSVAVWSDLAAAVGWRVELVNLDDQVVTWLGTPSAPQRDAAGRRYPAHLDLRAAGSAEDRRREEWARWRGRYELPHPGWTFHLDRSRRDVWRLFGHFGEWGCGSPAAGLVDVDDVWGSLDTQQLRLMIAMDTPPYGPGPFWPGPFWRRPPP